MTDKKTTGKPLEEDKHKVIELTDDEMDSVVGGFGLGDIPKGPTIDPDDVEDIVK